MHNHRSATQVNMARSMTEDEKKTQGFPRRTQFDGASKVVDHRKCASPSPNTDTQQTSLAVPFRGHIKDGLRIGKRIIVVGVVGSRPDRKCASPSPNTDTQQTSLAVPFRGHIKDGLRIGKRIIVVGVVGSRPDRFYILLSRGQGVQQKPPTDVALELCVNMKERQVLCRACVSGTWGDPQRTIPFFPFITGQPYKIEISCQQSRFLVSVDGQQLLGFRHKVSPLQDIDTLWIAGGLRITKLG
ncbi:hypothetical protein CRUP_026479 [Coryphaenoides rupestris]|nr:hypothetical protein CRUP_026479 [Coryphaenoides rupestris]